jgi:glycosyltransferase involved in cell wall biosynthesis
MPLRIVYAVHGWAFSSRRGIGSVLFAEAERAAAPLADAIVCVSERDRLVAETRRIAPRDRLYVIHNGIAAPRRAPLRGAWPERPTLVSTARLAPPKDLRLLLDALSQPGLEAWRLKVVGDGPDREAIEARRTSLGLSDRVQLLGERRDVREQLADADAFVLPTNSEGLPYSILEAMAMGLPVVASKVGGVPEEVVDGTTGLLVERGDARGLAAALRRLHANGAAARQMGIAGHARVRQLFSLDTMVRSYESVFRSLLPRPISVPASWTGWRPEAPHATVPANGFRRPRLLIVVTLAEVGGAQTFVSLLVEGLRARYDIDVASHGREGAIVDACERLGLRYHHVEHLVRDPDPRHDLPAIFEIRALVRRLQPDLVQLNSSKAGLVARVALANSVPVVFTAHGWAFARPGPTALAYAAIERTVAPLASAIVCVSERDRELALSLGVARSDRMHVVYNGVAVPEMPPQRGRWPDRPVLACIARLAPQKDVALLLDALALPGMQDWQLKVFGDGPDRAAIEQRIARHGLEPRVELCGDRRDVPQQLLACDALALPSNWEGLPYSILEAMGAALPVVASSVGGVPEMVIEGETGFLVRRGDTVGFAAALQRLQQDGARARSMGLAGHALVRARFGVATMIDRYDELFQAVLRVRAHEGARAPVRVRPMTIESLAAESPAALAVESPEVAAKRLRKAS